MDTGRCHGISVIGLRSGGGGVTKGRVGCSGVEVEVAFGGEGGAQERSARAGTPARLVSGTPPIVPAYVDVQPARILVSFA